VPLRDEILDILLERERQKEVTPKEIVILPLLTRPT